MRWLNGIIDSMDAIEFEQTLSLRKLRETVKDREDWHAAIHEVTKSFTQLNTEQQQEEDISIMSHLISMDVRLSSVK